MHSNRRILFSSTSPHFQLIGFMTPRWLRILFTVCIMVWVFPAISHAQEEDEESDPQLPEIAPREIEIRGELQLSFPSLQRQPLHGFASPPSVPSVPEDRSPYMAPYKQELENLPESLPTPEPASQSVTRSEPPAQGFLQFGGGRYLSRFGEGRVSLPLTSQQTLAFHGDYFGTEGFSPFDASDIQTWSDEYEAMVRFESRHDLVSIVANVHSTGAQYTLYGLPAVVQDTAANAPTRSGLSFGPGLELHTHGDVESSLQLTYDQTGYESQLDPTDPSSTSTFSEGRLAFDGSADFALSGLGVRLDGSAARSSYGGDVSTSSGYSVDAGASVHFVDTDRLSVRAGARTLNFEAPLDPLQSPSSAVTAAFVVPEARAELSLGPGVTLYAENAPELEGGHLADLYERNPYAEHAPPLRPTLFTTNAESGLLLSLGPIRFQTNAGFEYAPSYQYFVSPAGPRSVVLDPDEAPIQVEHGSARIIKGGGELVLQGIDGLEASLGMTVRDGSLGGNDTSIPYFSPLVADAMVSVSFADDKGLLQTTGTVESPRPVDRTGNETVGTFVSFDVEGSYDVTSLLDMVVQVKNVGPNAPTRWARYARPPTTVMGGFRIHW